MHRSDVAVYDERNGGGAPPAAPSSPSPVETLANQVLRVVDVVNKLVAQREASQRPMLMLLAAIAGLLAGIFIAVVAIAVRVWR